MSNFDFIGRWRPTDGGALGFMLRDRRNFSDINSAEFAHGIDSIWRTNDTSTVNDYTALVQLWWQQQFLDDRLTLTVGKVSYSAYFNQNRFADSDGTMFLSQPLSSNPVRRFPGNGLGFALKLIPKDEFYISIGGGDANGSPTTSGFNSIDEGEFFKVIEFGFTPQIAGLGKGNYRFTLNHTDSTDMARDSVAFSISADQDLKEQWGVYARYSINSEDLLAIKQVAAGGVVFRGPFGLDSDVVGLGVSWAEPSDNARRDQMGMEMFYRAQLSPRLQASPGVQFILDPANGTNSDFVAVFTLRLRVSF